MHLSKLSLALAGAILLTACGSDDNNYLESTPVETTPAAPAPAPTAVDFPAQTDAPETFNANENGTILTADTGLSLYFFANDEAGVSNCNADDDAPAGAYTQEDSCAGRWPPLLVQDNADVQPPFTPVELADGTLQWAYRDQPLYQFADDMAQGDVLGDGVGGVWYLARTAPIHTPQNDQLSHLTAANQVLSATSVGGVLETQRLQKDGFSLYTFDNDPLNTANCFNLGNGDCINAWPPLLADAGAVARGLFEHVKCTAGTISQFNALLSQC